MNVKIIKNSTGYYTSTINDNRTMFSFMNTRSASRCKNFLVQYSQVYGKFPGSNCIPIKLDNVLSIHDIDIKRAQNTCLLLNLGLIGITEFDYTFDKHHYDVKFRSENLMTDELENYRDSHELDRIRRKLFFGF